MRTKLLRITLTLTIVVVCTAVVDTRAEDGPGLMELFDMVNDHDRPCDDRMDAEHLLIERSRDTDGLVHAFQMLAEPIGERHISIEAAYIGIPGTGAAETDCLYLPVDAQIAYARFRIWQAFAKNGEPENERKLAFVALFEDYETELQFRQLLDLSMHNHSEALEDKLWSLFADRENDTDIRGLSVSTLSSITGVHSQISLIRYRRKIVEYAWEERGSDVAMIVGGRFGGPRFRHPYLNALKLDWYEQERDPDTRRSRMRHDFTIDRMDAYFGNISGLYRDPRARRDELIDKRAALQREARETGDDTKLREFEAEIAEQRREELEERIEKIDAWIAANRDRLEREAEEYAEQRAREREQEQQESG